MLFKYNVNMHWVNYLFYNNIMVAISLMTILWKIY